jgi:hypothetical protein
MKNNVTNFLELLIIIYAAPVATVRMSGGKIKNNPDYLQNKQQTPPWERRLKKQINALRKDTGRVQQVQRGNTSNRIEKHMRRILKKIHTHAKYNPSNVHTTEILDTLKQKLPAKSQRLRRYKEANERKQQNRLFIANEKTYYRSLKSERRLDCQDKLPDKQILKNFWASIWGNAARHNLKASWIRNEQKRVSNVTAMEHSPITTEQVSRLIAKTLNWKPPGPDGVSNFWIKRFTATH